MKKFLKISGGVVLGVLVLMFVLPFIFKGKIESVIKEQINASVNARVDYDDFSLSLFKSFPNIYVGVEGLSVIGNGVFKADTLVYLKQFVTEVGVIGALSGEAEVKSVLLSDLLVNAIVLPDSSANWDIAISSDEEVVQEDDSSEASAFKVVLESFVIDNATIKYNDATLALRSEIAGFGLNLSGDMSQQSTNLDITAGVEDVFVQYEEVDYVNGASLGLVAGLNADLENMIFKFLDNQLRINNLEMKLEGFVAVKEEGYGLDLKVGTTKTDFKSLLALIPEDYLKEFEELKTEGTMHLNASVIGDYLSEDELPAFDIDLGVESGMIQYPDLPESIDNINVSLKVSNSGGSSDNTITNMEQFYFEIADNPFDASLYLEKPVSNPTFKSDAKGIINLNSLANAIPLDSFDIKGIIEADMHLDGHYGLIESENYEEINAKGIVELTDFEYKSTDLPQGIFIKQSAMTLNPKAIRLESFDCTLGNSDFKLSGELSNYLAYLFKEGILQGKLNHSSKLINTNELLSLSSTDVEEGHAIEEDISLIEVPKNLDLSFQSLIKQLKYDKLDVYNTKGKITVKDGVVRLNGLNMQLLDGSMMMSGQYNTANMSKPFVDFSIEGKKLDLNKAAHSFSVVDSLLPLAKNTTGKVSPKFEYKSQLNKDAMPIMSTANGGGWLRSQSIEVANSKIQNTLASTLKNDSYRKMRAEDLNINFIIDKGNVIIKPFTTKIGGKAVRVEGKQGVDQSIDYKITMPVSRKEVANMAGLMGFSLPTSGDDLMVDVLVKGTVQDPQLSFGLDKAKKQVEKDLKKEGEKLLKNFLKGF
ncbi:AsmA-like C-terminal region-containing protein [Carboxylicivirga sp. M1479]|uniref:AsmA family protein n=1 Tax=Carboxylicivirga sp. M1479 TaxID=2594476 RepID=UPI0011779860|nr:AsmA-like C-terminal region-containing protein [Carboxylicivirga sp. M1479]TRX70798.1 AsmA family protein [Carboxylicivirga sp. M1479]